MLCFAEEANAAARNEWAECTRHALENFATAQKTLDALSEAHGHASQLAADLASRRSELNAAAEQAAQLAASAAAASVARPDGGISPAEHAAAAANMEKLSGVRVAAGAGAAAGELCVELLGLETPATLVLRMDRVGGRSVLRGARLEPAGTAAVEDLVAFAVALDDPAFLVEETRGRIRCSAQRRAEVAALGRVHLVFDQGATVRVTFPSGVMVALETGPDYPLGVGGVRLSALETMGVAKIKFERVRDVVAACATLTEAVQVLTTELPQK